MSMVDVVTFLWKNETTVREWTTRAIKGDTTTRKNMTREREREKVCP
jgi:hypothetical protein